MKGEDKKTHESERMGDGGSLGGDQKKNFVVIKNERPEKKFS